MNKRLIGLLGDGGQTLRATGADTSMTLEEAARAIDAYMGAAGDPGRFGGRGGWTCADLLGIG